VKGSEKPIQWRQTAAVVTLKMFMVQVVEMASTINVEFAA
jgi:hypothetical protein